LLRFFFSHFSFRPRIGLVVHATDFTALFITSPKDKEVFVGDSVQFDWDYRDDADQVRYVDFGKREISNRNEVKLRTILSKSPDAGIVYANTPADVKKRVIAVEDRKASFKIKHVMMNDSEMYFCTLKPKNNLHRTITDYVQLKVVGKFKSFIDVKTQCFSLTIHIHTHKILLKNPKENRLFNMFI